MNQSTKLNNLPESPITLKVEIDPFDNYNHIEIPKLVELLGLIPALIQDPKFADLPLWDALNAAYQHGSGLSILEDFEIGPNFTLTYLGDKSFTPIAKYTRNSQVAYHYLYGLMLIDKEGTLTVARMG